MRILFPSDFFDKKKVDADFAGEHAAARQAGFDVQVFDVEAVDQGDYKRAIKHMPEMEQGRPANCIMRGWMMRVEKYREFFTGLAEKNMRLINTWDRYAFTHHFPKNYKIIKEHTPYSIWVNARVERVLDGNGEVHEGVWNLTEIMDALKVFNGKPIIVKDYVKSAKHLWNDACFIPDSSDDDNVERVLRNFVIARGHGFNVGFVFREFIEFKSIDNHPKSGMPRINEFRIFWTGAPAVRKVPFFINKYWGDAAYLPGNEPDLEQFQHLADRISSDFFTMDVAQRPDGEWMIIEIGDGQTAGLPSPTDDEAFYRALAVAREQA